MGVRSAGVGKISQRAKYMETKMEKDKRIEVLFFGSNAVTGTVENVDKVTATIVFGMIFGAWSVTVPRTWIRKHEDRLLVELA